MSLIPSILDNRPSVFDPFSLDIWVPFRDMSIASSSVRDVANVNIDWKETGGAHVFKADLPGMKKEDIKVLIEDGNILEISGERSKEDEQKTDKWHRVERARGSFLRRFRLPDNAKSDEIKASMENGVLTVTVPKHPEPQVQVKAIDIAG